MTDTPDTQTEPENPDAEPETPIEGDDADAEEEDAEPTETPEAVFDASAEQWRQIDVASDAYIKKVVKIVGANSGLTPCDHCSGRGFTLPGQEQEVPMIHPENLVECEACNGYGQIITGSRAPDHALAMCTTCAGNGFVNKPVVQENLYKLPEAPVITAQQAQYGTMLPDGTFVPLGGAQQPTVNAWTP